MDKNGFKNKVDVIFVGDFLNGFRNSLGICLLSACLKRAGFKNIKVCDQRFSKIKKLIKANRFTFIAFSTLSVYTRPYLRLAEKLKRKFPEVVTLFGGPHPTFMPEMIENYGVDAVCRGEAERALVEFLENYDYRNKKVPENVPGWWIKDFNGRIIKNNRAEIINDIDSLPDPDRSLFPPFGKLHFIFSRGCPGYCSFCAMPGMKHFYDKNFKDYFRTRSVDKTLAEIKSVVASFGRQNLFFHDSIFGLDRNWLKEFSRRYRLEVGLPFFCNSSINIVDHEYLQLLKSAGCKNIFFGLETADQEVRRRVLKKNFTNTDFFSVIKLARSYGLEVDVFILIGLPDGKLEDDLNSMAMAAEASSNYHNISVQVLCYLPGTSIRKKYQTFFPKDKEDFRFSRNVKYPVLNYKSLRKDLHLLYRLQSLTTLFAYLVIPGLGIRRTIFELPPKVVKLLIHLPVFHISNMLAKKIIKHDSFKKNKKYFSFFKK
ncbi:MAG: B12-binding domain-containing radical SAM protein [Candidatus Omnitrophica bacterium]|nr:B12-binding domain-containing radical SAM protein [Candidatus Omnitrophota bacterium]